MKRALRWGLIVSAFYAVCGLVAEWYWAPNPDFLDAPNVVSKYRGGVTPEWVTTLLRTWYVVASLVVLVWMYAGRHLRDICDMTRSESMPRTPEGRKFRLCDEDELVVVSSVWSGPVQFSESAIYMNNSVLRPKWPALQLLETMSSTDPLIAPGGSGLWFHEATGLSVVLTNTGLVIWIEKRDMRPDLEKYLRLLDERNRKRAAR